MDTNKPIISLNDLRPVLKKHGLLIEENKRNYDKTLVLNESFNKIVQSDNCKFILPEVPDDYEPCPIVSRSFADSIELPVVYKDGGEK